MTKLARIRVGEWTVCAALNLIERGEKSVHIEPRAMDVLVLLAERAGSVVSVNEIMETVWSGVVVGDGSVYLAIRQLRQALGDGKGGRAYIETIPKRGYRLTADVGPLDADIEPPVEVARKAPPRPRFIYVGVVVVSLVVAAVWTFLEPSEQPSAASEAPPRLAVLPFVNASAEAGDEYFADGLARVLRDRLSRLQGLDVAGSAPSRRFKGSDAEIAVIGAELGVHHVLEADVRRSGDALRVSVRLTNVGSGLQLWSDQYEGTRADIFAFEDEITSSVAEALEITLGVGERGRMPGMTRDYRAHEEFVNGQGIDFDSEYQAIPRAIAHFQRAVDIDPSFGIGWLVLSNAYYHGALRVPAMAEEWLRRAPAARAQARALVPEDPWLSMLGARENVAAGNWFAAGAFFEGEMQQLIDETLGGNTPPSTYWLQGEYFLWAGRTSEARRSLERWQTVAAPEDDSGYFYLGLAYERTGDVEKALEAFDRGIEMRSAAVAVHGSALLTALTKRDPDEIRRRAEFFKTTPNGALNVRMAQLLDDRETALAEIREEAERIENHQVLALSALSNWAAYYGDPHLALALLRRMDRSGLNGAVVFADSWRMNLASVRHLPEFKDLVRELGLVEYWHAYGWSDHCRPVGQDDFECE